MLACFSAISFFLSLKFDVFQVPDFPYWNDNSGDLAI